MPPEEKFHPISIQLIRTPAASREVLRAASRGGPFEVPPGAAFALEAARRWAVFVLAKDFRPPKETPFVAFASESGLCDVVRARYSHEEFPELELAQTEYLCAIRVRQQGASELDDPDAVKVAKIAATLFGLTERVSLEVKGRFFGGVYGRKRVNPDTMPSGVISWFDAINWWQEGRDVGFLMIKYSGTPMRANIGPQQIYSTDWFGRE